MAAVLFLIIHFFACNQYFPNDHYYPDRLSLPFHIWLWNFNNS